MRDRYVTGVVPLGLRGLMRPTAVVEQVVAVPAGAQTPDLDKPRPDRFGRGIDRKASSVTSRSVAQRSIVFVGTSTGPTSASDP